MKKAKPKPPRRPAPPATPPGSGKRALNVEAVARSLRPQPRPSERYGTCRRSPRNCEGAELPREPEVETAKRPYCLARPHVWRRALLRRGRLDVCWRSSPEPRYSPNRRPFGAATLAALGIAALGGV